MQFLNYILTFIVSYDILNHMKKVFVLLFPVRSFLGTDPSLFNQCIRERYISKGYEFFVVKFKDSSLGFVDRVPNRVVDADITFEESNSATSKNWRYADFRSIAKQLNIHNCEQVVVGGFHCYDCVEKLATAIYFLGNNVLVDTDLTENFGRVSKYREDWNIKKYNPKINLEELLLWYYDYGSPKEKIEKYINKYKNPVYGISDKTMQKLKDKIKSQYEDETSLLNKK